MKTPRFNYIGIVAADLDTSLAFYRSLGLDIPEPEHGHVQITLPGGTALAWDTVETLESMGGWETPSGSPRISLAFECDSPADVDDAYATLVAAGSPGVHEPFDAVWGQRYAVVSDPDGNGIDLYAPL